MKTFLPVFLLLALAGRGYAQIGFGTASPNSSLDVRGGLAINLRAFTSNTSIGTSDYTLVFTGSSAATATLPDAAACGGRVYWIKNASTTTPVPVLTIATVSSQTIDGIGSWTLDEPYEVVRLMSDGANWRVASQNVPVNQSSSTGGGWLQGGNSVTATKNFGSITGYDLAFTTNNVEVMRLTSTGYLGLGTANPQGSFHSVNDNVSNGNIYYFDDYLNGTSVTAGFFVRKARGTFASPANLASGDVIGQFRFAGRYNGSLTRNGGSGIDAYYLGDGTTDTSDLRWFSSGNESMRLDQSGNLAIGTTSFTAANPEKLLVDAGTTGSYNVISGKGDIDNYLQLNIQNRSGGSSASSDVVATADNGNESVNYIDMGINSNGYSNTSLPILSATDQAYLYALGANFVIGNTTTGQDLVFISNGTATTNERMRITAAGNVGIGTTTPADKLTVAGVFSPAADNTYSMGKSGARWSAVWATNGTIQTSDIRMKTNIEPLEYGARELMQLKPVSYRWKKTPAGGLNIGLIAQQTRKLIPEVVTGNEKKDYLGMNYAELVAVLINTIKQQQARLQSLRQELEMLEKDTQ